jgi:hypothetical protein
MKLWSALLFFSLFAVYHLNWTCLDEGDSVSSANLPVALLVQGHLSFDPELFPEMFKWKSHPPFVERREFSFTSWLEEFGGKPAWEWRNSGQLELNGPRYYAVESPRRHVYVSTFGPVPGLMLLPVVAPFFALDHTLHTKPILRATVAKLGASALIAGCAVLLFLTLARLTTRKRALLLALTYGLCTCAWAVSSQNMWQQTANQPLLAAGAFFLLGEVDRKSIALLAGFFLGVATACRTTGAFALAAALVHLFLHHRRSMIPFVLASLPALVAIGIYNTYYFGNPLSSAQELMGHVIATDKTGSPVLWQTSLYRGALGLLVSPSRGLLIFSPVLAPAFWGIVRAFQKPEWRDLRPLGAYAVLTMTVQCKWFDWWGGHAYGYRPWLDAVPYLVLLLLPVSDDLTRTAFRRVLSGVVVAWSMFVQALGAWTYDRSWNTRPIYVVRLPNVTKTVGFFEQEDARRFADAERGHYLGPASCDIDLPYCRYRLWSLADNIILYHLTHLKKTRQGRLRMGWYALGKTQAEMEAGEDEKRKEEAASGD